MKYRTIIFFLLSIISIRLLAQQGKDFFAGKSQKEIIEWQKSVGDKWFNEHIDSALKEGDKMPDISLGSVSNNRTGKSRFSDFKDKIVIFDFWNTTCTSCIDLFPKMEKLQKDFGDKIQIFLVNTSESQDMIELKFKKNSKGVRMPDLPSITGPRMDIKKLFPARAVPHQVWIDGNGIICGIGGPENTYATKINELLANKKIFFLANSNYSPNFNSNKSYSSLIGKSIDPTKYNSFLTNYSKYYNANGRSTVKEFKDSLNNTIRNTIINTDIVSLYFKDVYGKVMNKNFKKTIWGPQIKYYSGNNQENYTLLFVKDTLQYTANYKNWQLTTERDVVKSGVCYEQITPMIMQETERRSRMLTDFNNYFGRLYGLTGSLEKKKTSCYVLVRISDKDKIKAVSAKMDIQFVTENGNDRLRIHKWPLKNALQHIFLKVFQEKEFKSYVIDESGYAGPVDLEITNISKMKNLDDIRAALKPYDLDIVPADRELDFVVLREKGYKQPVNKN